MEYFNNILCVEGGWLYDPQKGGILSKDNYDQLRARGQIQEVRRACKGYPALISYDSIPERFKQIIVAKFGDPYRTTKHNQFKDKIKPDTRAIEYFSSYKLPDGRNLPEENILEYTTNSAILNVIHEIVNNRRAMRKALGGSTVKLWDKISECVNGLDKNSLIGGYPHSLPANPRRLKEKYDKYRVSGYQSLIHTNFCNQNSRKVSDALERLILSLYAMPTKPYSASVHDMYLQFLSGILEVVDCQTGEIFDRSEFFDKNDTPVMISESTVWNYINDPKNRAIVDKVRTGGLEFNSTHRPHHHRHAPQFAFSKISMDDRDLRKMPDGVRVKAYYSYDVTSGCVIGAAYSKLKDKSLFIDCMRDMFRFMDRNGFGVPMEVEVEHHLVNNYKDDLMKAGFIFPFVRWCNPGNSQEKYAEPMNRVKKYGYEKRYQDGIGRFYSKLEANRPNIDKVFDEHNNTYKEKTYTFEQIVADDRAIIEQFNNAKHPNQKLYPGLSRLEVLKRFQNPNLAKPETALLLKYIGEKTQTSIRRSQYVTVQYEKYQLPSPEILKNLESNNYTVDAYYLWDENGQVNEVYLFQNSQFICKCEKIKTYNTATAEQTEADRENYTEQAKYVSKFDKMVKDGKQSLAKVQIIQDKTNYNEVKPEIVPVSPKQSLEEDWNFDDETDFINKALDY